MPHYRYVIVGGGLAAHEAACAIRELDASGPLAILADEPHRPYARPPLSKGLWTGTPEASVWLAPIPDIDLKLGAAVTRLLPAGREVVDERGTSYGYDALLLATGGRPRRLPDAEGVLYYRRLDDFWRLPRAAARRVVVIGGGFLGSELAAALVQAGREVTLVFPEPTLGAGRFPASLSRYLGDTFLERGVELQPSSYVASVSRRGGRALVTTTTGRELVGDLVVAALGLSPNDELAREAGLGVQGGVVVDEGLRTSDPCIYAAGDVAAFRHPQSERLGRVEHEDNAAAMGRAAGRAMAGAGEPYRHVPFFYSDLFELGYEAVGTIDATLETASVWRREHREGIVYYFDGPRIAGLLLWGTFGQVNLARALLASHAPVDRFALEPSLE